VACAGSESADDTGPDRLELTTNGTGADGCGCPSPTQQVEDVRRPLACACDPENGSRCPATLDEALAAMCTPGGGQTVIRVQGCGKISLEGPGGFVGTSQTFDADSGALIGVYEYSDITGGSCDAFRYISGDVLFIGSGLLVGASCPEGDYCMACGTGTYPACAR
jgi:hypothetical protein